MTELVVRMKNSNSIKGGVLVSTGLQEVQIACRGWSAGHAKSRPQLQLPKLSFLWQLS